MNRRLFQVGGDQDVCYHNFLCAHPAFGFADFNHFFSNVGYVAFGLLFLGVAAARQRLGRDVGAVPMGLPGGIYIAECSSVKHPFNQRFLVT